MKILLALMLIALPALSHAADADVCYSKPTTNPSKLTSKTMFKCPRAGRHTLPELAKAGWHIVTLQQDAVDLKDVSYAWMLVIEKP